MSELTPLRERFHDFPNNLNGINVLSYTFAYYLKELDLEKVKPDIKKEISDKLSSIEDYYKKARKDIMAISDILNKTALSSNYATYIDSINKKLQEINVLLGKVKAAYGKFNDSNMTQDIPKLANDLEKLPDSCHFTAGLVKEFKDKLIGDNKYYSIK